MIKSIRVKASFYFVVLKEVGLKPGRHTCKVYVLHCIISPTSTNQFLLAFLSRRRKKLGFSSESIISLFV